ncbi:sodium- and chloride-dependent neutral and basic amino acid transporter B(0+) [Musca domestica]|uniref:Sodium- and chloride-dependent neutral and basic amino acid transporter B(0+) n=1 Tax=Musca domestica TaxID=7370 RepID=A0A9J7CW00_MUSDO|nr:sodium- and chloride-dependent neutral and basic amino acid transporter B(0+) [Musca domestica]
MVYESSYESGRQPFLPDTKRGNWLNPQDFIYAGISLVFRIDIISMSLLASFDTGVLVLIPVYLLGMVIYTVPLMVLQSYMGQFSSSGFISAFRLSPIFKGIGFVSLITNIFILAYHSIFAMVPLLYMFASFNPTLPWSCEGFKTWAQNLTESEEINICNVYIRNETEPDISANDTSSNDTSSYVFINHHIPSVLYFQYLFHDLKVFRYDDFDFSMSWQLILCALMVWAIIAVIVYKFFQTEVIGTIVRYSVLVVIGLMVFFLIAFSFLPGSGHVFSHLFTMRWRDIVTGIITIPMHGMAAFGPGWGIFLTLSSFNKFRTNVIKQSCLIALGQFVVMIGLDFLTNLSETFFSEKTNGDYYAQVEHMWILYLSTGSVLTHFPWANLWSIIFYFMLFWSSVLLMILQLHTILTSILDEFDFLREKKLQVAYGLIGFLAAVSIYFTSNHGLTYFSALAIDTYNTQTAINLLLILIVLWIYGRERFQRDFEFMTSHRFSTWNVYILRFVAPLGMVLALIGGFFISHYEHKITSLVIDVCAIIFIAIPWLGIPGFVIYQMSRSMGSLKMRFLRCCRPTDWYPVEAEEKQKYEQLVGSVEITQTLSELKDEEVI